MCEMASLQCHRLKRGTSFTSAGMVKMQMRGKNGPLHLQAEDPIHLKSNLTLPIIQYL